MSWLRVQNRTRFNCTWVWLQSFCQVVIFFIPHHVMLMPLQLRTRVGSLQSEVARLQLLLPDDKGEYSTLKRELLELEKVRHRGNASHVQEPF
jgi:hypothetical protein